MNIRTFIVIAFLAPLAYLVFGYTLETPEFDRQIPSKVIPEPPKIETKEVVLIEINSIPPPFDLSGNDPYILWINGCRVIAPRQKIVEFVDQVWNDTIVPITTNDIHQGWIQPHYFENVSIEYPKGRTRSVVSENN